MAALGVRPFLVTIDAVAVVLGVSVMEVTSRGLSTDAPLRKTLAFGAILLAVFWAGGLHRSRLSLSVLDDLPSMLGRWLIAVTAAILGQIVWSRAVWQDYLINWRFLWGALAIGLFVIVLRAAGYAAVRSLRTRGVVTCRTLVIGGGSVAIQVAEILTAHPEYGLHPVGFLDADPPRRDRPLPLPLLGGPETLPLVLRSWQVHHVIVAFSSMKESEMVDMIRTCDRIGCEVCVVPRLFELHHVDGDMETAWGLPLVRLRRSTYRSPTWRLKRLVDVLVSGTHVVDRFRDLRPSYGARHRVPSGLTGWAQLHGRGDTSPADRARFDNHIENWSLWLDMRIMLRTIGSAMRGAGR